MKARLDLRAALAWAEALTRLPGGEAPDAAYEQACRHFSVAQVAELSLAVAEIDAIIDEALACHVGFLDAGAPLQTNVRSLRCERTFGGFMPPASHDSDYLGRLQDYFAEHRSLPSFSHMARLLGLRSVASAHAVAGRLKLAGFLQTTPDRRLAPGPRFFDRPVADSVRAGLPAAANDAGTETLTIDEFLVDSPSRTILLTVKGDSMIEAGLQPGDYIVVEKGRSARVGDIVVAIVDNEFTLKYLAQDKRGVYLKAGNPAYPPIRPQGQLEIFGLVTGSFRKYA